MLATTLHVMTCFELRRLFSSTWPYASTLLCVYEHDKRVKYKQTNVGVMYCTQVQHSGVLLFGTSPPDRQGGFLLLWLGRLRAIIHLQDLGHFLTISPVPGSIHCLCTFGLILFVTCQQHGLRGGIRSSVKISIEWRSQTSR